MTPQQLATVKVGDTINLRGDQGRVTQVAATWFMVTWDGGGPEIIRRTSSILIGRLELHA